MALVCILYNSIRIQKQIRVKKNWKKLNKRVALFEWSSQFSEVVLKQTLQKIELS